MSMVANHSKDLKGLIVQWLPDLNLLNLRKLWDHHLNLVEAKVEIIKA